MEDLANRLGALERDRDVMRTQIDDLHYKVTVLLRGNPDATTHLCAQVGGVVLEGGTITRPRDPAQDWVWIGNRARTVGPYAFCNKLVRDVVFSPNVMTRTIGEGAFQACKQLTDLRIPRSVAVIGPWAFFDSGVTNLSFEPGSVLNAIGDYSFCQILAEAVELPKSVTTVGQAAFKGCGRLLCISFGADSKVASIGGNAFCECAALRSIEFPAGVSVIRGHCMRACAALEAVTFAGAVVKILQGAFRDCVALKRIELPRSVAVLGERAEELKAARSGAFQGCAALEEVVIIGGHDAQLAEIGANSFAGCAKLRGFPPTPNLKFVGASAFSGCATLAGLPCLGEVEQIAESAFSGCAEIANVVFPASVVTIGARAFRGCSALAQITFAGGRLELLGDEAFAGCPLKKVTLPAGPKQIGVNALPCGWAVG